MKNRLNTCIKANTRNSKTKVASIKLFEENLVLRVKNISIEKMDVLKKQKSFKKSISFLALIISHYLPFC